MAKKVIGNLKLRIPAGRATAGPPVGSTLGQWGLNMMDFINPFNDATKGDMGKDVIVHIQVFEDRTFEWKSLGQPADDMIRAAAGIKKGSGKPHTDKVGTITRAQLAEIAEAKKDLLNANDDEARMKVIAGTARSMGVEIVDQIIEAILKILPVKGVFFVCKECPGTTLFMIVPGICTCHCLVKLYYVSNSKYNNQSKNDACEQR